MEGPKWLFVDVTKRSSMVSAITHKPELSYKAGTANEHGRQLYVSVDHLADIAPDIARILKEKITGVKND